MITHQQHHVVSRTTYFIVYIVLMALLGATMAAWYYPDLGLVGILLGDMIGIGKATIIILYFMHVRHSSKLVWVVAIAGFLMLAVLLGFTYSDYLTRPQFAPATPLPGG